MTALLATPTPYLRDGLRKLVTGLKRDAETVRLNLAQAEQDVAAARALLAEAEAQHKRAKDAADALDAEIAFFEEQAERTPPAYDPDAALAATGLLAHEEPEQATDLAPYFGEDVVIRTFGGHKIVGHLEAHGSAARVRQPDGQDCYVSPATIAEIQRVAVINPPPAYDPDAALAATGLMREDEPQHTGGNAEDCPVCRPLIDQPGGVLYPWHCTAAETDDLTAPGVADSRAEVARHLPVAPPVPHGPTGAPVATSGPLMTMPDLGPARERLDPPPGEGTHTHAKDRPGFLARLTGGHRTIRDEQDGDADE